jgi:hypothetical protein
VDRGLCDTAISPVEKPLIFRSAGIKSVHLAIKTDMSKTVTPITLSVQPLS